MLHKTLWLAGVLGAVCLVISAGMAQDQAPESGTTGTSPPAKDPGGVTLIPGRPAGGSAASADSGDKQQFARDVRRYQRNRSPVASAPAKPAPIQYRSAQPSGQSSATSSRPTARQPRPLAPGIRTYPRELSGTELPPRDALSGQPERPLNLLRTNPASTAQPRTLPDEPTALPIRAAGSARATQIPGPNSTATPPALPTAPPVIPADYATSEIRQPVVPVIATQPTAATRAEVAPPSLSIIPEYRPGTPAAPPKEFVKNFTKQSPQIQIQWRKKTDINVGQPCTLELIVKNTGDAAAANIEVAAEFPETVRLTGATPRPDAASGHATWNIPSLDAGQERRIEVTLIPLERGKIATNANVRFTSAATSMFTVEEPMLALALAGPEQVTLGEPASHIVTISNPGTGIAQNVNVLVTLPEGLEHSSRRNKLMMDLGSLSPGEKRNVRLSLTAVGGGEQTVVIDAKSGAELGQQSTSLVNVLAPKLEIGVKGPGLRYVGRDARYSVSIANSGAATTNNVRAMYAVPDGFEFQFASRGGKYDDETRIVSWFVGSVKPGDAIDLSLKLRPVMLGDFSHAARVVSEHGDIAEAQAATRIEGTASLILKVADLDDPVETGRETAYEVTVQNDGSKDARNVGLSIELPVGVKLIDVKGPTTHISESGLVVFKSLPGLPAGKTATFRIFVQGTEEGNQRLRARLTSDSIQEPLTVEELTRFYAD